MECSRLFEFAQGYFDNLVKGRKSDEIISLYEKQVAMGRKDAAERTASKYPWVKHSDGQLPPDLFIDVWEWFSELHSTRSVGFGVSAITFQEMQAFSLLRHELGPSDVQLIRSLDNLFLSAHAKKEK